MSKCNIKGIIVVLLILSHPTLKAQENDSIKTYHLNGSLSITNNGFSFVPAFNLGKPALISTFSVGGEKFSFDPQFRFDLDGLKPWSFIFIWRYNLVKTDRLLIRPGLHLPALGFRTRDIMVDGLLIKQNVPQRFFTPELTTNFNLSEKTSVGIYYIFGIGMEEAGQSKHTHFLSFRFGVKDMNLGGGIALSWNPEMYYMNIDGSEGIYFAQSVKLSYKDFPISISSIMNTGINTNINSGDFDWNISLVYSFNNTFTRK